MIDKFNGTAKGADSPFSNAWAVTPSDGTELQERPRALYIGGAGSVIVRFPGSSTNITFAGVPAGTVLMIRPSHVMTGGTATNILALV